MGGAARVVLDQCRLLHGAGWTVHLAAGPQTGSEGSFWPEAREMESRALLTLHEIPTLVRELSPLNDLRALAAVRRLARKHRPGLVHSHTSKAGLLCAIAGLGSGTPVLYTPHGHIFGAGARIPGVPDRGMMRSLLLRLRKAAHRHSRLTVVLNQADCDDHVRLGLCPQSKLRIVHNGIDIAKYRPATDAERRAARAGFRLPPADSVVGFAARLTAEKGVAMLATVAGLMQGSPQVTFLVAGDGPLRPLVEGLSNVRMLGQLSEMAHFYRAIDILMVPSEYEAQGLSALEAMSSEVPVVAFRVGGLPEAVLDGINGRLVSPGDAASMAGAIRQLLDSPEQRREFGARAREHVAAEFSCDSMLKGYLSAYGELVQ